MKARGQFKITEYQNASGTTSYRVTGTMPDGKRIRENFSTEAEATGRQRNLVDVEMKNIEPAQDLKRTKLTREQLDDAERATFELHKEKPGKSLLEVVRYYLTNYREPVKQITLRAAYDEFYKVKSTTVLRNGVPKYRPRTLQKINSRVGTFASRYPDVMVSAVTVDQIAGQITRGGAVNQNSNRSELRSFFNWTVKKGYCAENLVLKTEKVEDGEKDIAALSLTECRKLIDAAQTYQTEQHSPAGDGGLIPFLTLGLFAGLRPEEIQRLSWDNINIEDKVITVSSGKAKTRTRRVVEMSDNLVEWLTPYKLKRREIYWPRLKKHFAKMRAMAGFRPAEKLTLAVDRKTKHLKPWIQDYLRHTAVSNHLKFHGDAAKTALWAGHDESILHECYKALVTTKDAAEFWQIRPDKKKIIAFKKAA